MLKNGVFRDSKKHLYNSPIEAASVISFNQPQNVAQIIDLLAAWKRIQLIVQNWKTKCKVYFNISENGIIQYRNRLKIHYFHEIGENLKIAEK